ncbi:M42 family metallopeptidase [Candidatus Bipolaricaulota bacterium]|jgi:endoglucanase|nr:M42 family metallopeptidase [Candidatus Bipolaricaulota bacterium]TFH08731.1 MAG: M42 family peptidase [Candidatus Atribacteria bacterium]
MQTIDLLRQLSDTFGVSGFEDDVRELVRSLVTPFVDEVKTDALGNLFAIRRCSNPEAKTLMLDAHMDEIGFIVKWVEEDGFLRFAPLGGWDPRIVPGHRVEIQTRSGRIQTGVIGTAPPHILSDEARKAPLPLEQMFIDIGAPSLEDAQAMGIRIGDPLTIHYPFMALTDDCVTGKAFDDRAGCAVLIETAERLAQQNLDVTVVYAFVFGEEVGLRGARTAAFQIEPDLAIAVEGTIGADMPGVPDHSQPVRLGFGPAISVADRSIIITRKVLHAMEAIADEAGIAYQYKLPTYGGTDAGAIHLVRGGVLAGIVSVPCRYIHSPISTLRLSDFELTSRYVTELVKHLPGAVL